jgi:hypothetical protein
MTLAKAVQHNIGIIVQYDYGEIICTVFGYRPVGSGLADQGSKRTVPLLPCYLLVALFV